MRQYATHQDYNIFSGLMEKPIAKNLGPALLMNSGPLKLIRIEADFIAFKAGKA